MEQPTAHPAAGSDEERKDIQENKDIAAFGYIWVMSVVVYLLRGKSPFVRFHSKQAMVLFVLTIPAWFIPIIGPFIELILMGAMVLGFLNAAQGHKKDIPIIGPLSRGEITIRQAWKQLVDSIAAGWKALFDSMHTKEKPSTPPAHASTDTTSSPSPDSSSPINPKS